MKKHISHKFVASSFAIALSATLISKPTLGAEIELNEYNKNTPMNNTNLDHKRSNIADRDKNVQNSTKPINNSSENEAPSNSNQIDNKTSGDATTDS
ncbi:hypothetical protein M4L21_15790, partial [Staphylococcus equorum]|nr:hypothetical protein [Staphylococcus equorum]